MKRLFASPIFPALFALKVLASIALGFILGVFRF